MPPRVHEPSANVVRRIAEHAASRGASPAVSDSERSLTYAQLWDRVARAAAWLEEQEVRRGDRVALVLGNRSAYLELVFAAAQLGAMAVPINARLTAWEIRRLLDDCTPSVLCHDAEHAEVALGACDGAAAPPHARMVCGPAGSPYEAALAAATPRGEIEAVSPDAPMLLMYTSGTTGAPKGALLPHRKTLYNCLNAERFFGLTPDDRILVALPLFHSFGLAILSLPALHAGASVTLQPRFDPATVWATAARDRITFFGGVPTMFERLLEELERRLPERLDLQSLRFLFTAGAAIPVDTIRAFKRHGLVLKQGYGQTETSILCCLDSADSLRKAGSVGRPVHHAELRVIDAATLAGPVESWRDAAIGEPGEIVVRGPITMLGYWQRPNETAATLRDDWLRTGDLASIDSDGFVTLVGRARDMYISGGENVYPAEVEAVFEEHPAIREIAVIGVPDPRWGESGRAFVVLEDGETLDGKALLAWGSEYLARFKLPREFVAIDALPRTETGKVQKHRLTEDSRNGRKSAF
jgi:fatty-acyl-CoA synthase